MTDAYRRSLRTPAITVVVQNLLEVDAATPYDLADRTGQPLSNIYRALARLGSHALVQSVATPTTDDAWGRVPYLYSLTGEGKNLAAFWGMTPRPRDVPLQGQPA